MELSGIIFVALAVAWAAYLLPKALRHHDEVSRSRSVERFSNTMRVLARREPVTGSSARLVVQPGRSDNATEVTVKGAAASTPGATPAQIRARREATRVATARRRRVFSILLFLNVAVAAVATAGVVGWVWQSAPAGLMVVWLVLCRLMVRSEIAADAVLLGHAPVEDAALEDDADDLPADYDVDRNDQGFDEVAPSAETATINAIDPELWDPVPVTLPTYVNKPAAVRRTVRTINLSEPGAWTSGRTDEDAAIAREADAADKAERDDRDQGDGKVAVNS
ncbi:MULTISPECIES: hypothetical protein [unclassified Nocardioides]|uniref:divisome protein SepX/GlpR n=1 Tax=unclassified Nocardioides TaxID=2615069 RepID=UPI0006F6363E|nr:MULTISPECIES: hypothetical protein [unclassified Nocardioides]KQY56790.1 hypothetical protein ASD30_10815 [Nocardioides sp. Root140]KQZ67014.1 hypothetical protein ASD66_18625 [Nocardioides sp. Root151]KRF12910.1 hypothetical protein ASH02_15465 [Nocardioides sp. Soil796]